MGGSCADIAAFAHYFAKLESRVSALLKEGVSLAELRDRCDLPEFARWDQYETLHPQNANRTYLRLERAQLEFAYRFGAGLYLVLFSAVFLVVILVLPRGIVPSVADLINRWRRRARTDVATPAEQRVPSP